MELGPDVRDAAVEVTTRSESRMIEAFCRKKCPVDLQSAQFVQFDFILRM